MNLWITQPARGYISEIKRFYSSVEEYVEIGGNEQILTMRRGKSIVGSIRLVKHRSYYVLRTLNVAPSKQRQGIGTQLVRNLIKLVPEKSVIYCLPYSHLERFYKKFGFKRITPKRLPQMMYRRYHDYIPDFDVIAMKLKV